jgi:hypothetical protein
MTETRIEPMHPSPLEKKTNTPPGYPDPTEPYAERCRGGRARGASKRSAHRRLGVLRDDARRPLAPRRTEVGLKSDWLSCVAAMGPAPRRPATECAAASGPRAPSP